MITNKREYHSDHQLHDGLNVLNDTQDFIKFHITTAKYIFDFLAHGIYLREVFLFKNKKNEILFGKRYNLSNVNTLVHLLKFGANIQTNYGNILLHAAHNGFLDIIKFLVEYVINDLGICVDSLLTHLSNTHLYIVQYLVHKREVKYVCDCILIMAAEKGHLDVIMYLEEMKWINEDALVYAIRYANKFCHCHIMEYFGCN